MGRACCGPKGIEAECAALVVLFYGVVTDRRSTCLDLHHATNPCYRCRHD